MSQQKPHMSQKVTPWARYNLLPPQQGNITAKTPVPPSPSSSPHPSPPCSGQVGMAPREGPGPSQLFGGTDRALCSPRLPGVRGEVGNRQLNEQQHPCPRADRQRSPPGRVVRRPPGGQPWRSHPGTPWDAPGLGRMDLPWGLTADLLLDLLGGVQPVLQRGDSR